MAQATKKDFKPSAGERKARRAARLIRQFKMKINRWKRYQAEIDAGKRKGKKSRWETAGLEQQIKVLEKVS